jgi:hypothetical protein
MRHAVIAVLCTATMAAAAGLAVSHAAQTDLDTFMASVLATRDQNWKKLQQYILDEREQIEVVGPARMRLWGDQRDYTWFLRDGFFVRSPLKANGASVSEADRRKYEDDFLRRAKAREKGGPNAGRGEPATKDDAPSTVEGLIAQTRQPQFIDSAYFLRFTFEPGHYALAGRETIDGRETLRIEYYPARLFTHEQNAEDQRRRDRRRDDHEDVEASMERMMNKVSLVTLWVDAAAHQIVRYTFDNVGLDFLPGAWLMRIDDMKASMTMSQPFPGVWLPRDVDATVNATMAMGDVGVRYHLEYHDYREATASGRVILPAGR